MTKKLNNELSARVAGACAKQKSRRGAPGKYVELTACMDVVMLISNCPQLNNPCNGYNPTPIEVLIWNH